MIPPSTTPPDERRAKPPAPRSGFGRSDHRVGTLPHRRGKRRWLQLVFLVLLILLLLPVPFVIAYRFVPPPVTTLMLIRALGGAGLHKDWQPLDRISPNLVRAVIASEDEKFCFHHGFDWQAEQNAFDDWRAGRTPKGASTITMQAAKNLFLWPGRSVIRKGFEAYITVMLEFFWDKRRIVEVYLNVIEWGDGLYGADAAAHRYFNKPASALTVPEAALLAAVLPNPRRWSPVQPTGYIAERAATIRARMNEVTTTGGACR